MRRRVAVKRSFGIGPVAGMVALMLGAGSLTLGVATRAQGSHVRIHVSTRAVAVVRATTVSHKKKRAHPPLTPKRFVTAMTGKNYPPGVKASSSKTWGAFQQYGTEGVPSALAVLGGVESPDLASSIDYYVFPTSQAAAAFYASPPVGIVGFNFQGMSLLSGVDVPSHSKAFGLTECGGSDTELTPTTCSNGSPSPPFVVGTAIYSLSGFVVTVAARNVGTGPYVTLSGVVRAESAAAKKAGPVLRAGLAFLKKVEG